MSLPLKSISATAEFWRSFDMEMRKDFISKTIDVVADNGKRSSAHRKALAKSTKEFRGLSEAERIQQLGSFVKSWQTEVDDLTARAQFAEKAFLELSKSIKSAPDPSPILLAAQRDIPLVANLRQKNKELNQEVKELEKEFDGLSNQDITIRKLEAQIAALNSEQEDKIEKVADSRILQMEAEFDEKSKALEEDRKNFMRQVAAARESEVQAQTRADIAESRLFAERSRAEEQVATMQDDIDRLSEAQLSAEARAESAEQRLQSTLQEQKRNTKRSALKSPKNGGAAEGFESKGDYPEPEEDESVAQHHLVQKLQDELMVKNAKLLRASAELEKARAMVDAMGEGSHHTSQGMSASSPTTALSAASPESMAQQESLLAVEGSKDEKDTEGYRAVVHKTLEKEALALPQKTALQIALSEQTTLTNHLKLKIETLHEDVLFMARQVLTGETRENLPTSVTHVTDDVIKQTLRDVANEYESTVIQMRQNLSDKKDELLRVSKSERQLRDKAQGQHNLINTLEEHIRKLQFESNSAAETETHQNNDGGNSGSSGSNFDRNLQLTPVKASSEANLLESVLQQKSTDHSILSSSEAVNAKGESMLKIVQCQRDRYRQRVQDLEKAKAIEESNSRSYVLEIERLKQDNLRLYEKVRFFQSLPNSSSSSVSRSLTHKHARVDLEAGLERRYAKVYEEKINPFNAFSAEEKSRRLKNLNVFDKALLIAARAIMLNRYTRAGLFLYLGLLHFILFGILHSWSHAHHLMHAHHKATPFHINRAKGSSSVIPK